MSNVNSQLKKGVITPDGKVFDNVADARDYMRAPLIKAALKKIAAGNDNLATFLLDNEDEIMKAFEVGTIARVTRAERKKLEKALEHLLTIDDSKLRFIKENHAAVLESFRWPSVKRLKDEEKAAQTLEILTKLADANAAAWIIANKDGIVDAYDAGIEKRAAPTNGGLEEYRAAKAAGPDALAAYNAKRDANKKAAKEAAAAKKAA